MYIAPRSRRWCFTENERCLLSTGPDGDPPRAVELCLQSLIAIAVPLALALIAAAFVTPA